MMRSINEEGKIITLGVGRNSLGKRTAVVRSSPWDPELADDIHRSYTRVKVKAKGTPYAGK